MLRTDRFPRANEIWDDLPGADQTWVRWKLIYRKANMADKVKKSAQGGQDHFGSHGAFGKVLDPEEPEAMPQLSVEELDGYFSSLANAATTEKDILAAMVISNATLTTSPQETVSAQHCVCRKEEESGVRDRVARLVRLLLGVFHIDIYFTTDRKSVVK